MTEEYSEEEVEIEEEIEVYDDHDNDMEHDAQIDAKCSKIAEQTVTVPDNYVPETFEQLNAMYRPKNFTVETKQMQKTNDAIMQAKMPEPETVQPSLSNKLVGMEAKVKVDANLPKTDHNVVGGAVVSTNDAKENINEQANNYAYNFDADNEVEAEDDDGEDEDEDEDEDEAEDDDESYELENLDDDDASDFDDSELMNRLEAKYGRLPAKEHASDADIDDADDAVDADAATWTQIKPKQTLDAAQANKLGNGIDDADDAENAEHDFELFEQELRKANEEMLKKNYIFALQALAQLSQKYANKPEAFLANAQALDHYAELQQSNRLLTKALYHYKRYLAFGALIKNDTAYTTAAERCIQRMRFMGYHLQAVPIHELLIERFSDVPKYRNQLTLTYLMANRIADVKKVAAATLRHWPNDALAQLYYGFALRQIDSAYEQAAYYMQQGLDSNATGSQESFFYLMLGDTLQRLGRQQQAFEIYKRATDLHLFASIYQRSLYNVASLRAQPFWHANETGYQEHFQALENNWLAIRQEAMNLLDEQQNYFKNETEHLRDTGMWQQFELFARGERLQRNCMKAPITCELIAEFRAASGCRRGQVKFSIMHGSTHVWPHCGPTNCRLRAHLGLVVPAGTSIRVATLERTWQEGKVLIFDDSFEHEVWHNGTSLRLILIIDIWHPDLSEEQQQTLTAI